MRVIAPWFPTKPCNRCGGNGRYSYNAIHGDTCYGCSGTGQQFRNRAIGDLCVEWRKIAKTAREALAGADGFDPRQALNVGDPGVGERRPHRLLDPEGRP